MREPQFQIEDLAAEYRLHPDCRHVYVEGPDDKAFYDWFLASLDKHTQVMTFSIQSVYVPDSTLDRLALPRGSDRSRVIALAVEIASRIGDSLPHVTCVADADFDYLLGTTRECALLFYTDGTSIEMYAYQRSVLEKLLRVLRPALHATASQVLATLQPTLVDIFLVRAANIELQWNMEALPFAKRCTVDEHGGLGFDASAYVRDYLSKNSQLSRIDTFQAVCARLRLAVLSDPKKFIRGHDYVELLARYLSHRLPKSKRAFRDPDALWPALCACIEHRHIAQEGLFRTLAERLA